jgi:RHS repeat-associated protein
MSCTLSNTGGANATSITYGTATSTTLSGTVTSCNANSTCGTVKVTTSTTAGTYSGTLTATPNAGTAASQGISLTVNTQPVLSLSSCTSTTPTTSPTAASMSCTLGNSGQGTATMTYASGSGTTATGPASCAGATTNCGTVKVTTATSAGSYTGSVTATPNVGSAVSQSYSLTVNSLAVLTLTNCSSTSTITPTQASMVCTLNNSGQTSASTITYATSNSGTTVSGTAASCAANTNNCGTVTLKSGTATGTYAGTLTATPNAGTAASQGFSLTVSAAKVVTYIHTDGLGSPVARTDASGNLVSRTRYEPYGMTAAGATPTVGFTGHVNDADTGLTYMQARYYDPVAGRFMSIDPVMTDANTGDSFNRYYYANNNPYKYIDPDGRDFKFAPGSSDAFKKDIQEMRDYLHAHKADSALKKIDNLKTTIIIKAANGTNDMHYEPSTKTIVVDSKSALIVGDGKVQTPALGFLHEAGHALHDLTTNKTFEKDIRTPDAKFDTKEEKRTIETIENPAANKLREPTRSDHGGVPKQVECSTCTN